MNGSPMEHTDGSLIVNQVNLELDHSLKEWFMDGYLKIDGL